MTTYKDAGVDIEAGSQAVKRIKGLVKGTFSKDVLLDVGAFGGSVSAEKLKKFDKPVLISSIDGVGTKTKIASAMNKWDSVGKDIVNHSCNDVLCCGAEPWFFVDYVASSTIEPEKVEQIVKGMAEACKENNVSLIAGETAEMPGVYEQGETDIVGAITGVAERDKMVDGSKIQEGNVLVSLPSSGLHTNGYSLARKVVFEIAGLGVNDKVDGVEGTVGQALLAPHKSYVKEVLPLAKESRVNGIAHITGGGLVDNIGRLLPEGLGAKIEKAKLRVPGIFKFIQEKGEVPDEDMFKTFNMGSGMVLIVDKAEAEKIIGELDGAWVIGEIVKGKDVEII
ncbi:MAG: phosphoribosylformylglycinamidine cyclo-ligase [archaeon]|nr:phosphoribosylformylglycinamidine cyclo-ligase [archaeon]